MKINSNILWATGYFLLSAVLTSIFIGNKFWFYDSVEAMILSGSIAGGKWLIQIIAALALLQESKWAFIKRIGFVCLLGSLVLFSYNILLYMPLPLGGFSLFVLSIVLSVGVMIIIYYKAVRKTGLSLWWFWGWLLCLCIAVFLQMKVVF